MFRLVCRVEIQQQGNGRSDTYYWDKVNTITLARSYDKQTQTASVILPRNIKYNDRNVYEGENPIMRRGDRIIITAAYHPNQTVIFTGYIAKINNNVPIELLCEDEMFLIKQAIAPNITSNSITLEEFLKKVLSEKSVPFEAINADLGKIRFPSLNVGKILQILRDEYGLYSFFINGKLYVGLAFYPKLATEHYMLFERDMTADGMKLTYLKKDDVKVKVVGVIIEGTKRTEYTYGDPTGDVRTVSQIGGTKAQLDVKCNSFLEQANYTGYYGSFETFLEPKIVPGDYIVVDSWKYPERKGKYLVKSVSTTVSTDNGGKQVIELERRIA
jgi:hypothetical protein